MSYSSFMLETLQRHPLMILTTCVLVLIGAYLYLGRMTPLFTSRARVYVEQKIPKVVGESEEGVMSRLDSYLYTQAEIIHSAPVLMDVVNRLDVEHMRSFAQVGNQMYVLYAGLETDIGKMNGIIDVSFKAPDPREAADIVNAVVDAYVGFHNEQKRVEVAALLRVLEDARIERKAEVTEKHEQLLEFTQKHEGLAFGSNQEDNVVVHHMEKLLAQLSEARVATRQAESFYETGRTMAENPAALRQVLETWRGHGIDASAVNEMAALRTELKELKRDKANVLLELKGIHPAVATLEARIKQIQDRMVELDKIFVQHQLAVLRQEHLDAKLREEELAKQCETQRQQVLSLHDQQAEYAVLQSDYSEAKKAFDVLNGRIRELHVTEEVGGLTVSVLERGGVAGAPSDPKKVRFMGMALFVGAFAGIGLALLRELLDKRLRSSEDMSALLGLPVLAAIPRMRTDLRSGVLRARVIRACPVSPEAEAFRRLSMPLLVGPENVKTILVTSPAQGEGKTLVASNLALAMVQAGLRVLIIDADCRAPKLHRIFKENGHTKGLCEVLTGQVSLDDAIKSTAIDNLDTLAGDRVMSNMDGMFTCARLKSVLATLAERYDRVLIDSPPLLVAAETQALASHCDGSVLVLRAGISTRQDSIQGYSELIRVRARVLGIVVNGVSHKGSHYYGGGHYSHYRSLGSAVQGNQPRPSEDLLPFELMFGKDKHLTGTTTG